jgi:hypothetical protein
LPEVTYSSFHHYHLFLQICALLSFLQISTLPTLELSPIVRYLWPKELTDDEDDLTSSPIHKRKDPSATEDAGPSHEEVMAEEPAVPVHHRILGSGGCMHGVGGRIISCHPSPALCADLETMREFAATFQLPKRKEVLQIIALHLLSPFSSNILV